MELFTAIKNALISRLRRIPWMDEKTRKEAQNRVSSGVKDRSQESEGVELSIGSRDHTGGRRVQRHKDTWQV